jgi:filamentous hemagglutinin family protein
MKGSFMYKIARSFVSVILLMILVYPFVSNHCCFAGVATDGSQGPQRSLAGPDFAVTDDLGQIRGANLFHSFSEFDLNADESATFSGPAAIENIIGRITGGNPSLIDGTIRSDISGADLFLLNPTGIMFGPNAALDISGSFYAGTADYLRFDDGAVFNADPARQSVLSVAPPEAFGFLSADPAGISLNDSRLEVPSGETFALVGGDIDITGTTRQASISAPGGEIDLIGVGAVGEVNPDAPQLLSSEGTKSGDIHISNAQISVEDEAAERVVIKGGRIQIENGSTIRSEYSRATDAVEAGLDVEAASQIEISGESGLFLYSTGAGNGGDLQIRAAELVLRDDMSLIWNRTTGEGDGGDIRIDVDALKLDRGNITTVSGSSGDGGAIRINAADSVVIEGRGTESGQGYGINSMLANQGTGRPGEITINTGLLDLRNQGNIFSVTTGSSGTINIDAEVIHLNYSSIFTMGSNGEVGDISIHADKFEAFNNSIVGADTSGTANAGMITLAADSVLLDGSSISSSSLQLSDTSHPGNGGDIHIEADQLTLQNNGRIYVSSTRGAGDAGNIFIQVADTINLSDGSDIDAEARDMGNAGDINISAHTIKLNGDSDIGASTFGPGQGGKISIQAHNLGLYGESSIDSISNGSGNGGSVEINCDGDMHLDDGGWINATTAENGKGGDIHITAGNLLLSNNAEINARSIIAADAGNITIDVEGDLTVNQSWITTDSKQADGGDIRINAGNLIHLVDGKVKADIGGGAGTTGGNIHFKSTNVVLNESQVMADALEGRGGNINILADTYLADPLSVVDASSELGIDGVVDIRAPLSNLSGSLKPLLKDFLDAADLLKAPCEARVKGGDYGSFIVKGRDALPMEPGSLQISPPLEF